MKASRFKWISIFMVAAAVGVGVSYAKLYLFHLVLLPVLGIGFYELLKHGFCAPQLRLPSRMHYLFPAMLGWYALTLLWGLHIQYALKYLFYVVCGISISLTIVYSYRQTAALRGLVKLLGIVFLVEAGFALLESFTSFRLPVSPYSDLLPFVGRGVGLDPAMEPELRAMYKSFPTGFHWNPNNLAILMVIICPFFLFSRNKFLAAAGYCVALLIVIQTSSRGCYIAMVLATVGYLFFYLNKKYWYVSVSGLVCLVLLTCTLRQSHNGKYRDVGTSFDALLVFVTKDVNQEEGSVAVRQNLARNGLEALLNSRGLGIGGGCSNAIQAGGRHRTGQVTSMHNFWLEMLVEGGVPMMLAFGIWYGFLGICLYRHRKKATDPALQYLARSCSLSLFGFWAAAASASSVIYYFPMWLLLGVSVATYNLLKQPVANETVVAG